MDDLVANRYRRNRQDRIDRSNEREPADKDCKRMEVEAFRHIQRDQRLQGKQRCTCHERADAHADPRDQLLEARTANLGPKA